MAGVRLFTLLDGVVIAELPPSVIEEPNLIVGVLAATFGNLVLIGAVAPFLARRLARRDDLGTTERELLQDRVAAIALALGLAACLVSGLANRPVIVSETEATEEVGRELRAYVERSESEELRRNLETANTIRLSDGYFRTCVARDDRRRYFCLLIDTDKEPTEVKRDREPGRTRATLRPTLRAADQRRLAAPRPRRPRRCCARAASPPRAPFTAKLSCLLPRR